MSHGHGKGHEGDKGGDGGHGHDDHDHDHVGEIVHHVASEFFADLVGMAPHHHDPIKEEEKGIRQQSRARSPTEVEESDRAFQEWKARKVQVKKEDEAEKFGKSLRTFLIWGGILLLIILLVAWRYYIGYAIGWVGGLRALPIL